METNSPTSSQLTSTESFSYSWLATEPLEPSQQKTNVSLDNQEGNTPNFNFDLSMSKSNPSPSLVHADKLFSNGLILPGTLDHEPSRQGGTCSSSSPSPLQLVSSKINLPSSSSSSPFRRVFLGKWSKFIPGKIFSKYIKCLVPMKESIAMGGTRVDDVHRLAWKAKSWSTNNTPQIASPMRESAAYCNAWSDIDESSIREAILYCKKSSGLC